MYIPLQCSMGYFFAFNTIFDRTESIQFNCNDEDKFHKPINKAVIVSISSEELVVVSSWSWSSWSSNNFLPPNVFNCAFVLGVVIVRPNWHNLPACAPMRNIHDRGSTNVSVVGMLVSLSSFWGDTLWLCCSVPVPDDDDNAASKMILVGDDNDNGGDMLLVLLDIRLLPLLKALTSTLTVLFNSTAVASSSSTAIINCDITTTTRAILFVVTMMMTDIDWRKK